MIVNLTTSIEVNRSPDEAFDYIAANFPLNITDMPLDKTTYKVEKVTDGLPGVGTVYRTYTTNQGISEGTGLKMGPIEPDFSSGTKSSDLTVVKFEPGKRYALTMDETDSRGLIEFKFSKSKAGTRITLNLHGESTVSSDMPGGTRGSGCFALYVKLYMRLFGRKFVDKWLQRIKELIEA